MLLQNLRFQPEQGGFAAAASAHEGAGGAGRHRERDAIQDGLTLPVAKAHVPELDVVAALRRRQVDGARIVL